MTKPPIFQCVAMVSFFCLIIIGDLFSQTGRGMKPITVHTTAGEIQLYKDSYALVVGNGTYTKGWDPLEGALKDVKEVETALKKHGFNVTLKKDLTKAKFDRAFAEFVLKSGEAANNRLLFYYAGHGYTRKGATGEAFGYLVMVDAPTPEVNKIDFELESIPMESLVTQAEKILARHVLFIFDSCFSGTILNVRDRLRRPSESISDNVKYPVRQFITAGRAGEVVPDHSDFKQAFLDLIEGRADEPFRDGYITGEELGFYLKNQVPVYNPTQHPQYGKIRNPKLDKGDFVFVLPAEPLPPTPPLLMVTSTPSGADIYVDNAWIGKSPLTSHKMDIGVRHEKRVTVVLELSGYKRAITQLTLRSGQQTPWDVRLEKIISRTGTLTVTSTPSGASVYIEGEGDSIGQTPLHDYEIDTGRAREKQIEIRLELSGYKSHVERLVLRGGQQTLRDIPLEKIISRTGTLTVTSTPSGASVYIEGEGDSIGQTPLHDYEIDTGRAREKQIEIRLELSGYKSHVERLVLRGGQQTLWEVRLEETKIRQSSDSLEGMVFIPAGDFQMGSNDGNFDEKPVHTVYVDAFYIDIYEVTNVQYKEFVDANPWWGKDQIPRRYHDGNYLKHWTGNSYGRGNHPVVYVSWYGAMAYAEWAGKHLPTEAEWERAARGGLSGKKYPWEGDSIDANKANYNSNLGGTTAVGSYAPNPYGLYDIAGNVWEWCLDEYQGNYYKISPRRNPIARVNSITDITSNFTNIKNNRVLRGGSWVGNSRSLRVADRRGNAPTFTNPYFRFRCARTAPP